MTLRAGEVISFKGVNSRERVDDFAAALQGRCKRQGDQLQITRNTRIRITVEADAPAFSGATFAANAAEPPASTRQYAGHDDGYDVAVQPGRFNA